MHITKTIANLRRGKRSFKYQIFNSILTFLLLLVEGGVGLFSVFSHVGSKGLENSIELTASLWLDFLSCLSLLNNRTYVHCYKLITDLFGFTSMLRLVGDGILPVAQAALLL